MGTTNEPEVVDGAELGVILRKWVDDWYIERPKNFKSVGVSLGNDEADTVTGSYGSDDHVPLVSPYEYIKNNTSIDLTVSRFGDLIRGRIKQVALSDADAILTAIGKSYLLSDGTIKVLKNRTWDLEGWLEYMQDRGCSY